MISAGFGHILNVLLSEYLKIITNSGNGCVWYFMNLWGDVTVGTLLNYAFFELLDHYAVKYGIEELKSGMYVTEDVNLVTTDK